jgi:hypothetical protein
VLEKKVCILVVDSQCGWKWQGLHEADLLCQFWVESVLLSEKVVLGSCFNKPLGGGKKSPSLTVEAGQHLRAGVLEV